MRVALLSLLLSTGLAAESVYEFQGPRRNPQHSSIPTGRHYRRKSPTALSGSPTPTAALAPTPRVGQRPAPAHLSSWGGTLIQTDSNGWFITSNGPLPPGSVVCVGRGDRYLGQAQVASSADSSALIEPLGGADFEAGDWVTLVSVPAPPASPGYAGYAGYASSYPSGYHPSSTNADPTYQRWLRQGFTMGGFTYPGCRSGGGFHLRPITSHRW